MRTTLFNFSQRLIKSLNEKHTVGRFEGIVLVDRKCNPHFLKTITAALKLIKTVDPRRFRRVVRQLEVISNDIHPFGGATYVHHRKTCEIDFGRREISDDGMRFYAAWYACTIVHEATHGRIDSWGILYDIRSRVQIERLCVAEEKRFARRILTPAIRSWLEPKLHFDPARWERSWNTPPWRKLARVVVRIVRNR